LQRSTGDEDDEVSTTENIDNNKSLFRHAYQYLKPGALLRAVVYIYGERKLFVFFMLHFVATMITWVHFALIKWEEQKASVPDGAPFYWWKRIAPPLEFGSMHAILLQMALIPLTMSRYSISALSESVLDRYVPLNRMVRIHIHLGYVMVGIIFFATVFFFAFFGLLCANGDESFCDKFTSEIMCTGYGILGSLLIIGGTSYFRHNIPYEVFYGKYKDRPAHK
jgi:nitric oxide reductase large subunit